MSRQFTFANEGQDATLDSIVNGFSALVDMRKSKDFIDNEEYRDMNKTFSESIIKYCCEQINKEFTSLEDLKNPMFTGNAFFKQTFDTVLAQIITPVMPKMTSDKYNTLYDVAQVGFGDNAKYEVDSNELFIISEFAEGIARGGVQTLYNDEYTVKATKRTVTIGVDWYHVASGKHDWGKWGMRLSKSFEAYINASVIKALTSVISSEDKRREHGIGGYCANGINDINWLTIAKNVSLANGGAPVYALGTSIGLAEVLPEATDGFRFNSDDDYVTKGHLPLYKKVPLFEIDNGLVPNTVNGTPVSLVSDDYIYMIAMGSHKPVKVVFEGNTVTVHEDPSQTKDRTYALTVEMRIGVDVIVGSKFGVITK